jgi:hypothetical protein
MLARNPDILNKVEDAIAAFNKGGSFHELVAFFRDAGSELGVRMNNSTPFTGKRTIDRAVRLGAALQNVERDLKRAETIKVSEAGRESVIYTSSDRRAFEQLNVQDQSMLLDQKLLEDKSETGAALTVLCIARANNNNSGLTSGYQIDIRVLSESFGERQRMAKASEAKFKLAL